MRILAVGNKKIRANGIRGFTLLELLVVLSIMALATVGVGLAMRDGTQAQLERDAERLAALLESARAQSRASGVPVRWLALSNSGASVRPSRLSTRRWMSVAASPWVEYRATSMPAAGQPCMVSRTWVLRPIGNLLKWGLRRIGDGSRAAVCRLKVYTLFAIHRIMQPWNLHPPVPLLMR